MSQLPRLQAVFNEVFESQPTITTETVKSDISDWDSINHLSLILALESAFDKKFSVEEIERLTSVKLILEALDK